MRRMSRVFTVAVVSVSIAVVAVAQQTPALNVNMGLWELTSAINIGGDRPAMDTSKMTPEQKARMEAAMQGMMGQHTSTTKSCITKDKFNKTTFFENEDPNTTCTQTLSTNTRSTLDVTVVCTGARPQTNQLHFDALSPTSFKGTIKSSSVARGQTMTMNGILTGKWLGADCKGVD